MIYTYTKIGIKRGNSYRRSEKEHAKLHWYVSTLIEVFLNQKKNYISWLNQISAYFIWKSFAMFISPCCIQILFCFIILFTMQSILPLLHSSKYDPGGPRPLMPRGFHIITFYVSLWSPIRCNISHTMIIECIVNIKNRFSPITFPHNLRFFLSVYLFLLYA